MNPQDIARLITEDPDVLAEGSNKSYDDYMKTKVRLTKEERDLVMGRKAIWHHGPNGEATPAVWKSKNKNGSFTYITNTHRAMNIATTLKGAIKRYHDFIKGTA